MSLDTIAAMIGAGAAAIGLGYVAYQIHSDNKTRQLETLQNVYKGIQELEQRFYDKYTDATEEKRKTWDYQFFNQLEWFAFLVNHEKIKDEELTNYFKPAVIEWYEKMFVVHFKKEIVEDQTKFEEFKKLYKKFKQS